MQSFNSLDGKILIRRRLTVILPITDRQVKGHYACYIQKGQFNVNLELPVNMTVWTLVADGTRPTSVSEMWRKWHAHLIKP